MAFQAVCVLVGVFVCSTYVKGSPQPQARVYLTFDGKKVDKQSEKNVEVFFFLNADKKISKESKIIIEYWLALKIV